MKLFTLAEVGEALGLSRTSVYELIRGGRLRVVSIGRNVRVTETELRRFIESLEQEALGRQEMGQ